MLLFWELFSGSLFFMGGLLTSNWVLAAIGFAIGCSPLMRTRLENNILMFGVGMFWVLILYQIYVDVTSGFLPIEHLLVLMGISDANWG